MHYEKDQARYVALTLSRGRLFHCYSRVNNETTQIESKSLNE